jgi:DNA-binding IclR family transcriptional regulator
MDGEELVDLLRHRRGLLRALDEQPRARHELVDAVEDSKSTVYKRLAQLEDAGLIERNEGSRRFAPTLFGFLALVRYDGLVATAEVGDPLAELSGSAVNPETLVESEVIRPDEADVERHIETL